MKCAPLCYNWNFATTYTPPVVFILRTSMTIGNINVFDYIYENFNLNTSNLLSLTAEYMPPPFHACPELSP